MPLTAWLLLSRPVVLSDELFQVALVNQFQNKVLQDPTVLGMVSMIWMIVIVLVGIVVIEQNSKMRW